MPPLPAPSTVRVAIRQAQGDDSDILNIFHYAVDAAGPYSAAVLDNIAQGFFANWVSQILPLQSNGLSVQEVTTHDISVAHGGDGSFVPAGSPPIGGEGGSATPASASMVLSWREFISYRGGHPRTYVGGMPNSFVSTVQQWAAADASAMQSAALAFLGDVNGQVGWTTAEPGHLVVVHYSLSKVVQNPPLLEPILGVAVGTRIHSQRRRLN